MRADEIAEALDFLYWARDRIVAAAGRLPDAAFSSETPRATRSLRATLAHQIECEWAWRVRLSAGAFPEGDVRPDAFDSVTALRIRWSQEEHALRALAASLDDETLAAAPTGPDQALATWRYLLYVVNHGMQQFAEAAFLLTELGQSPGEIGYLAFCADRIRSTGDES